MPFLCHERLSGCASLSLSASLSLQSLVDRRSTYLSLSFSLSLSLALALSESECQ